MSGRLRASAGGRAGRATGRCANRSLRCLFVRVGLMVIWLIGSGPRVAIPGERADESAGSAGPVIRLAIAPFVGEGEGSLISSQLATRFERLGVDRLLAPGSFVAERDFDPRADVVRTWAYQAAVDTIVVGRVEQPRAQSEAQQIEAVVRSGHSGAELFRHAVHVPARAALGSALDQLAAAIVQDLGGDPLAAAIPETVPPTPAVSANAESTTPGAVPPTQASSRSTAPAEVPEKATGTGGKGGSEARLGVAGFQSDAPIEINADEAEILAQGENRKLIFKGGVRVRQDNLSLASDLLEAEYEAGESEPKRLVAQGAVHVAQGNRSARCDRAEYLRSTQKVTCRGHAELIQGCDVVRGELIVLDLAGDKARVEGAASIVISPKQNGDVGCSVPGRKP